MASAQAVFLKSGEQPRLFTFGSSFLTVTPPVVSVVANQASMPLYKEGIYSTFQGSLKGTGAGLTATITIQCSNDDNTGRGYFPPGANAPGFVVSTAVSTTLTSLAGQFSQALVGALVVAPGVPVGTLVSSVTNANTLIMSAAGTVAAVGVQCQFYDVQWCLTSLGVITLASTGPSTDGFTTSAAWRYVRANLTNVAGAGITGVSVVMGV